ncbi:carboxypeptidase-like regulatory domain-containing protein [Zavarzinella formosa]|uniref:carboxypeptidase-like regulatory domain-containing protein n=1 Tax=Zavarzinella formosa TaxID=360055 RepID=UPI0012FAA426|nr:carboxypeptidase-like regulatory domain-containing protein [Zavarzinella formosa]
MKSCCLRIAMIGLLGWLTGCGNSSTDSQTKGLLTGKITVGGQPARQVMITAIGSGGVAGTTSTDTGEFTIPDPPKGKLKFTIFGSQPGVKPAANSASVVPPKYAGPNELEFDYTGGSQHFDIQMGVNGASAK